jgi:uncharacterized protein YbgA (DUF1722 family)/uncharacterized protein YbbK (DUF523 family)
MGPIRLGVSSCLLGQRVRYDGGHKRDAYIDEVLGQWFEWVPVCPEVEAGLGLPRPSMRLVRQGKDVRLLEVESGRDHTRALERVAAQRVRALRSLELCGYLLKKDSPSCGMAKVKVYGPKGMPERSGQGLFAKTLLRAFPALPVEEEGRLRDAGLRENFIERVFAYARLRALFHGRWTRGGVVAFHTAHKLQLMAHSPVAYRALGRRVAALADTPRREFLDRYGQEFMAALAVRATRGRNTNVLHHCAGYFKRQLDAGARAELAGLIEDYRQGLVPLVVPLTLILHHARTGEVAYLQGQTWLEPHPRELMLRNHV